MKEFGRGDVISGGGNMNIYFWNFRKNETISRKSIQQTTCVTSLEYISDHQKLICGYNTGACVLEVFDMKKEKFKEYRGHTQWVWGSCGLNNSLFASTSADHSTRIWSLKKKDCVHHFPSAHTSQGRWIRPFGYFGIDCVSLGEAGTFVCYDLSKQKVKQSLRVSGNCFYGFDVYHPQKLCILGGADRKIHFVDARSCSSKNRGGSSAFPHTELSRVDTPWCFLSLPRLHQFLVGTASGNIYSYDIRKYDKHLFLQLHACAQNCYKMELVDVNNRSNGQFVCTGDCSGYVRVFQVQSKGMKKLHERKETSYIYGITSIRKTRYQHRDYLSFYPDLFFDGDNNVDDMEEGEEKEEILRKQREENERCDYFHDEFLEEQREKEEEDGEGTSLCQEISFFDQKFFIPKTFLKLSQMDIDQLQQQQQNNSSSSSSSSTKKFFEKYSKVITKLDEKMIFNIFLQRKNIFLRFIMKKMFFEGPQVFLDYYSFFWMYKISVGMIFLCEDCLKPMIHSQFFPHHHLIYLFLLGVARFETSSSSLLNTFFSKKRKRKLQKLEEYLSQKEEEEEEDIFRSSLGMKNERSKTKKEESVSSVDDDGLKKGEKEKDSLNTGKRHIQGFESYFCCFLMNTFKEMEEELNSSPILLSQIPNLLHQIEIWKKQKDLYQLRECGNVFKNKKDRLSKGAFSQLLIKEEEEKDKKMFNLTIETCDGGICYAHQEILMLNWPFYFSMIRFGGHESEMIQETARIQLAYITTNQLSNLLHFYYTGTIQPDFSKQQQDKGKTGEFKLSNECLFSLCNHAEMFDDQKLMRVLFNMLENRLETLKNEKEVRKFLFRFGYLMESEFLKEKFLKKVNCFTLSEKDIQLILGRSVDEFQISKQINEFRKKIQETKKENKELELMNKSLEKSLE